MRISKYAFVVTLLLMVSGNTLLPLNIDVGIKIPVNMGLDITSSSGLWPGFITGGGLTCEIGFLENTIMTNSRFAFEAFGLFSLDQYFLPADKFASGSYIHSYNIRYGGNFLFYFFRNWYAGLGATLVYAFAGNYGTPSFNTNFTAEMIGNDIYLSAVGGFEFELIRDRLYLPLDLKISYGLTIPNANVIEIGLNAALKYRFNIVFPTNQKTVQTNIPPEEPAAKLTAGDIQKLGVPEIVALARKAVKENEIDYAKLLVKEGLLKEPDNPDLLSLFNVLMKK